MMKYLDVRTLQAAPDREDAELFRMFQGRGVANSMMMIRDGNRLALVSREATALRENLSYARAAAARAQEERLTIRQALRNLVAAIRETVA